MNTSITFNNTSNIMEIKTNYQLILKLQLDKEHNIITSYQIGNKWSTILEDNQEDLLKIYNRLSSSSVGTSTVTDNKSNNTYFNGFIIIDNIKYELSSNYIIDHKNIKEIIIEYYHINNNNFM